MIRNTAIIIAALLASGTSQAATFNAVLSGANERPNPVATRATGFGKLFLAADRNSFTVDIDFTGLSTNAVAGHVHCCASTAANGPVAIGFSVPSATTGTITGNFNLLLQSTYNATFFNTRGGGTIAGARSAFLAGLDGNLAYFNVHTSAFPGGEIRGQLGAVPEPASWAMLIAGFGLTGAAMRRRAARTPALAEIATRSGARA
ncbi:CHRD domain-containing protein [Sandarakinorhabdus sp.]|uniref:CHRD domain-containing protein n=1 Tax=Sandarakinorhabdus sp. TaxID=1916663 RepID=UPI00286E65A0|nr:CHRD domain-containing protein [Sandarakinorhabdus sp.]